MIKNERQYKITKAQAAKLEHTLAELSRSASTEEGVHPLLLRAEREGIHSQLDDLRAELNEYEQLRSGKYKSPVLNMFAEFPLILIKARIASGLTQRELAQRLGVKEQQIQKYESTEYASASLSRIMEVARALGVELEDASFVCPSRVSLASLVNRLKEAGLDRDLIMKRIVPPSLFEQARVDSSEGSDSLVYQVAHHVGRIFGWAPHDTLNQPVAELAATLVPARLKAAVNANEKRVNAYLVYAHYLALTLTQAMKTQECAAVPEDPYETRQAIVGRYGSLTLANVLDYLWDSGIMVLPLNDPGVFHGAYFRENNRHVIVLKQRTPSASRWMFDALHEAYHTLQEPEKPNLVVIEHDDMSREGSSSEEIIASQYAGAVLLGKNPQRLAEQCIQEAHRDLRMLKSAVKKVAYMEDVPVDSLANYIAFRLSIDGQNWWGAAKNLQSGGPNPFSVARDILLQRIDLTKLADYDIQLVQRALAE